MCHSDFCRWDATDIPSTDLENWCNDLPEHSMLCSCMRVLCCDTSAISWQVNKRSYIMKVSLKVGMLHINLYNHSGNLSWRHLHMCGFERTFSQSEMCKKGSYLPCVPRKPNTAAAIITLHMEAWSSVDGDWYPGAHLGQKHPRSVTYYVYEVGIAEASCMEDNDFLPNLGDSVLLTCSQKQYPFLMVTTHDTMGMWQAPRHFVTIHPWNQAEPFERSNDWLPAYTVRTIPTPNIIGECLAYCFCLFSINSLPCVQLPGTLENWHGDLFDLFCATMTLHLFQFSVRVPIQHSHVTVHPKILFGNNKHHKNAKNTSRVWFLDIHSRWTFDIHTTCNGYVSLRTMGLWVWTPGLTSWASWLSN